LTIFTAVTKNSLVKCGRNFEQTTPFVHQTLIYDMLLELKQLTNILKSCP